MHCMPWSKWSEGYFSNQADFCAFCNLLLFIFQLYRWIFHHLRPTYQLNFHPQTELDLALEFSCMERCQEIFNQLHVAVLYYIGYMQLGHMSVCSNSAYLKGSSVQDLLIGWASRQDIAWTNSLVWTCCVQSMLVGKYTGSEKFYHYYWKWRIIGDYFVWLYYI